MAVEVPCPNCKSVLRAPDDAAGRKVKCKKCEHRFYLPGGPPAAVPVDSAAESQMLSVVESPAIVPAPAAPPSSGNPFEFDPGGAVVVTTHQESDHGRRKKKDTAPPSRKKDDPRAAEDDDDPKPKKKKKLLLILLILGGGFTAFAAAGGAAVYFLLLKTKDGLAEIAKGPAPTPAPVEAKAAKPAAGEGRNTKGKEKESLRDSARKGKAAEPAEPTPMTEMEPKEPPAKAAPAGPGAGMPSAAGAAAQQPTTRFTLPPAPTGKTTVVAKPKDNHSVDAPHPSVKAIRVAYGNPPVAMVLWNAFAGFQGTGAKDAVDVISLSTGKRSDRIEFPADGFTGARLFEIAGNGSRLAIEQPAGRLTVYDLEQKAKILDGVELFAGVAGFMGPPTAFRFITPEKLAVTDRAGSLTVWDLKTMKRTVTGPALAQVTAKDPPAAISNLAGERLFVFARGGVTPVNATTGVAMPVVPLPEATWLPLAIGVDPLGKRAAVAYKAPNTDPPFGLAVINVEKPGIDRMIPLPPESGIPSQVRFFGNEVIALVSDAGATSLLYDVETSTPTGYLKAEKGAALQYADEISGRLWWALPDLTDMKKTTLHSVEVPFDDYFKMVNSAKGEKKPVFVQLRPDGLAK